MKKGKLLDSEQIAGALRRARGEPDKTVDPVNLDKQAEDAVKGVRQAKTPPIGLLEEETGKYVLIFPDENRRLVCKSKSHAMGVAKGYGVTTPDFKPYREVFDPCRPDQVFKGESGFEWNIYEKSPYQLSAVAAEPPDKWQTISKLIENVIPDQSARDAFMNWLAVVFNTGKKTQTAWVILGPQGSGKTLLVTKVVFPLLGLANCIQLNQDALTTRFNTLLQRKQMVCFNEVHSSLKAADRIKTWITESDIRLEEKSGHAFMDTNYLNLIFTSNSEVPVKLDVDDRRFNVVRTGGPLNDLAWFNGAGTVKAIERELKSFAAYLHGYSFSAEQARRPIVTPEKLALIEASVDPIDRLAEMLRRKQVKELKELGVEAAISTDELSELSDLSNHLPKEMVLQLANGLSDKEISQTKLTQELSKRGFGEKRGKAGTAGRKRVYVWGSDQNLDKSDN